MRMKEERQQQLYSDIHEPVMDLRLKVQRRMPLKDDLDAMLFELVLQIWKKQKQTLNIQEGGHG